jgi:ABC-type proline/glycine betaine transport system permease subunit
MTSVEADPRENMEEPEPVGRKRQSFGDILRGNYDLFVEPLIVIVALAIAIGVVYNGQLDEIERLSLAPAFVLSSLGKHMVLVLLSTIAVLVIAVPVGILVSRPTARRAQGIVLTIGGFAQALPPFGVLVLLAFLISFGAGTAVLGLTLAALLPVLRNTVVGLQQVDQSLIEAARGMGMSARQTLFRVEIPLAVPVIVAGLRVALVLNVGNAVLASYIGGGGLGDIVVQSLTLSRTPVLIVSGTIIACLALLVDWLAGVAERVIVARSG